MAERQRTEAREHALAALAVTSRLRDQVTPEARLIGSKYDPSREFAAKYERDDIRELRDLGVLIPDPMIRVLIASACNLVTAANSASEAYGHEESAREIQRGAMHRLRGILGAYLRIEPPDQEDIAWVTAHAARQEEAWAEMERLDDEFRDRSRKELNS